MQSLARILVVRTGALGDVILTLPAIASIRESNPQAEIHLVGNPGRLALAQHLCSRIHDIDQGRWAPWFASPSTPDSDLGQNPLRSFLGGVDLVITYMSDPDETFARNLLNAGTNEVLTHSPHPPDDGSLHAIEHLLLPMVNRGWHPESLVPKVVVPDDERAFARSRIPEGDGPLLIVHPGSGSPRKCWPAEKFAQAAEHIATEWGADVLITGGPADEGLPEIVAGLMSTSPVCLRPGGPLDFAAVLDRATLYLGNDSGPSHLAAAVGTPTVVLFGPTDPATWAPRGADVRVLQNTSLNAISIENVVGAALADAPGEDRPDPSVVG